MDHLNHRLNEISSRLNHLERLTLQIQRDSNLNHEELKQYISATFNLIQSSFNNNQPTATANNETPLKSSVPNYHQDINHRLSGSATFDLLVPATTSPYLGSEPSNGADHHQQPQILHSQYSLQLPVQRSSIFNQQLALPPSQLLLPTNLSGTESHLQRSANEQLRHQQHLLLESQQQQQNQRHQQLHLHESHEQEQLKEQHQGQHDRSQDQRQGMNDDPSIPSALSDSSDPKLGDRDPDSHENIPLITIKRSLATVEDIWREYYYGLENNPSIRSLDAQYGRLWRDKKKERTYFRRKKIFAFIEKYMEIYNCDETQAIEYLENYRKDADSGKKRTLMWLYTHMPSLSNEP